MRGADDGHGRPGILFSRFWSTVHLHPDCDMAAEPLPVGEGFGGAHAIAVAAWNHDGVEDLASLTATASYSCSSRS